MNADAVGRRLAVRILREGRTLTVDLTPIELHA
jgi:hypothetical protein